MDTRERRKAVTDACREMRSAFAPIPRCPVAGSVRDQSLSLPAFPGKGLDCGKPLDA